MPQVSLSILPLAPSPSYTGSLEGPSAFLLAEKIYKGLTLAVFKQNDGTLFGTCNGKKVSLKGFPLTLNDSDIENAIDTLAQGKLESDGQFMTLTVRLDGGGDNPSKKNSGNKKATPSSTSSGRQPSTAAGSQQDAHAALQQFAQAGLQKINEMMLAQSHFEQSQQTMYKDKVASYNHAKLALQNYVSAFGENYEGAERCRQLIRNLYILYPDLKAKSSR